MKHPLSFCSAVLALLLGVGAPPASAATFVVSNLNDRGAGSLRAAISSAAVTAEDDTITFSVNGTITLQSALEFEGREGRGPDGVSRGSLVIDGTGQSVTISGNNTVQVFSDSDRNRTPDLKITFKALTITGGKSSNADAVISVNTGNLHLIDCVVSGNSTQSGQSVVFANRNLEVVNSTFSGNSISGYGSVIYTGANNSAQYVTIKGSRFTGNFSPDGSNANVIQARSPTTITNSSFESNRSLSGAVFATGTALLTVTGSTFKGNSGSPRNGLGGGAVSTDVPTTIINSTFHANSVAGTGAAIFARSSGTASTVTVINSTLSGNVSGTGSAVAMDSGSRVLLRNTILANSSGGNCSGGVVDGGGNLSDDMSCGFTTNSSLNGTAAQLGPLADNGGPTLTMMPLTGSPAIDQGVNALALDAAGAPLANDQRGSGFARIAPSGGTVDRGAVEAPAAPPLVLASCPTATAQVGVAYSSALVATGGSGNRLFSTTGNLPPGLALTPGSGSLIGTPTAPGNYSFTAEVAPAANPATRSSKVCTMAVAEAAKPVGRLLVTRLAVPAVHAPAQMKWVVTLTNIGNPSWPPVKNAASPVSLGPVTLTPSPGTPAGAFTFSNHCPARLTVWRPCTITVVVAASPAGEKRATLNIPNNAPGGTQVVVLQAADLP